MRRWDVFNLSVTRPNSHATFHRRRFNIPSYNAHALAWKPISIQPCRKDAWCHEARCLIVKSATAIRISSIKQSFHHGIGMPDNPLCPQKIALTRKESYSREATGHIHMNPVEDIKPDNLPNALREGQQQSSVHNVPFCVSASFLKGLGIWKTSSTNPLYVPSNMVLEA